MKLKRVLSLALSAALMLGLFILPPESRARAVNGSAFADISDPEVAEAVEVLRLLGAVNGNGGNNYVPNGTLTRGEFCKLAVVVMGKESLEPAQRNRTIFLDVPSTHWARGYINLATSLTPGGEMAGGDSKISARLISGVGNGNFEPDRPIKYAEAVTLLVRILGFTDADVATGSAWYDGYLTTAAARGLTQGLNVGAMDTLTRGQAALLFRNLIFTPVKDSQTCYLEAKLGGALADDKIVLSYSSTSATGRAAIKLAGQEDSVLTDRLGISADLVGIRGKMATDKNGRFLTLLPNESDTIRRVTLTSAPTKDGNLVVGSERISIPNNATVWRGSQQETFSQAMSKLYSGTNLVLCYGADGRLNYLCVTSGTGISTAGSTSMVARTDPKGRNPFASLTGGDTGYQIYKNGVPATAEDLRQYDVATYDSTSKILQVSDLRLTGQYENADPNPTLPTTVTVMGKQFTVLPEAAADLASFKIGNTVTLLLTVNGEVAGAVEPKQARSNIVGIVEECSESSATVRPLVDIPGADGAPVKFSGDPNLGSSYAANNLVGQIVTISSYEKGQITLNKVRGSGATGDLDLDALKVGSISLSDNVRFFEKVGTSSLVEINPSQITLTSVPNSKIAYVNRDYSKKINIVVLEDVTGDLYSYGFLLRGESHQSSSLGDVVNTTVSVRNSAGDSTPLITGLTFSPNQVGGIVSAAVEDKAAAIVFLTDVRGVASRQFNLEEHYVTLNGARYPIASNVQCYNRSTGTWFNNEVAEGDSNGWAALERALNFSDEFIVYYDKSPDQGGKIRMVTFR